MKHGNSNLGTEVLTAVVMKSYSVWDITQWNSLEFSQNFGGVGRLRLQD
jgi:hypothetical protein